MTFVPNANKKAEDLLKRDNIVAAHKSALEAMQKKYRHKFVESLQIYVLKIGMVLCECVPGQSLKANTYLGSLDFICNKVLQNKQLYNVMRAIEINEGGNAMKHSIDDVNVNIDFVVNQYNNFISEIVKNTNLSAFKKCYLVVKSKNERDIPIAKDAIHHKYFTINNLKFQLKISPDYTVDQYSKKLTSKITLYWPDGYNDWYADVEIKNDRTHKIMGHAEKLNLSSGNDKHAFALTCGEKDLDRRKLDLTVKITLFKKKNRMYTTGALFWKKEHSESYYEEITAKTEKLSQFFLSH